MSENKQKYYNHNKQFKPNNYHKQEFKKDNQTEVKKEEHKQNFKKEDKKQEFKKEEQNQDFKKEGKKEEIKNYYNEQVDDLCPPQDLNLKLQIEKENSIALTNMLKTLQADFDNYRKRNAKVREEAYLEGVNDTIKRMLKCYDAVDGALKTIKDAEVKKGLEILEREFLNAFNEFGVTTINAFGEMFNADYHNAIASEEKPGEPSGKIINEVQKGFMNKDKVIRYSLVIIAK